MDNLSFLSTSIWTNLFSPIMIILCFYFTLHFFHQLKSGDERTIKHSKLAAVICLAIALLVPAIYNLYLMNKFME